MHLGATRCSDVEADVRAFVGPNSKKDDNIVIFNNVNNGVSVEVIWNGRIQGEIIVGGFEALASNLDSQNRAAQEIRSDTSGSPTAGRFPRVWSLFAYLLPRAVRERVYEPAHQELLEDYLTARRSYRTKRARRWLTLCFTVRTAVMWGQSLGAWMGERGLKALRWLVIALAGERAIRAVRWLFFDLFRRL
jgi:hypothetical protein